MHRPIALATIVVGTLAAFAPAPEPSAEARCLLGVLAAEGFRVKPHPTDSTRRMLTRTLTGIDRFGIGPSTSDSRVEMVEVRIDPGRPGLAIEQVSTLQPVGSMGAKEVSTGELDRRVRTLLREAEPRCSAR